MTWSLQTVIHVAAITTPLHNTDLQVASRKQAPRRLLRSPELESVSLMSLPHSTFSAVGPSSPSSEVLKGHGDRGLGPGGVIIQASGSNEIILSNEAATSALL